MVVTVGRKVEVREIGGGHAAADGGLGRVGGRGRRPHVFAGGVAICRGGRGRVVV